MMNSLSGQNLSRCILCNVLINDDCSSINLIDHFVHHHNLSPKLVDLADAVPYNLDNVWVRHPEVLQRARLLKLLQELLVLCSSIPLSRSDDVIIQVSNSLYNTLQLVPGSIRDKLVKRPCVIRKCSDSENISPSRPLQKRVSSENIVIPVKRARQSMLYSGSFQNKYSNNDDDNDESAVAGIEVCSSSAQSSSDVSVVETLNLHLLKESNTSIVPKCSQIDPKRLSVALSTVGNQKNPPCLMCSELITGRNMMSHVWYIHFAPCYDLLPFSCSSCEYKFVTLNDVLRHLRFVHHRKKVGLMFFEGIDYQFDDILLPNTFFEMYDKCFGISKVYEMYSPRRQSQSSVKQIANKILDRAKSTNSVIPLAFKCRVCQVSMKKSVLKNHAWQHLADAKVYQGNCLHCPKPNYFSTWVVLAKHLGNKHRVLYASENRDYTWHEADYYPQLKTQLKLCFGKTIAHSMDSTLLKTATVKIEVLNATCKMCKHGFSFENEVETIENLVDHVYSHCDQTVARYQTFECVHCPFVVFPNFECITEHLLELHGKTCDNIAEDVDFRDGRRDFRCQAFKKFLKCFPNLPMPEQLLNTSVLNITFTIEQEDTEKSCTVCEEVVKIDEIDSHVWKHLEMKQWFCPCGVESFTQDEIFEHLGNFNDNCGEHSCENRQIQYKSFFGAMKTECFDT